MKENRIVVKLTDGRSLVATDKCDNEYPGIRIEILDADGKASTLAAWYEYNTARSEYAEEERLRALLWDKDHDEPVINLSYDTGRMETD